MDTIELIERLRQWQDGGGGDEDLALSELTAAVLALEGTGRHRVFVEAGLAVGEFLSRVIEHVPGSEPRALALLRALARSEDEFVRECALSYEFFYDPTGSSALELAALLSGGSVIDHITALGSLRQVLGGSSARRAAARRVLELAGISEADVEAALD